MDGQARPETEHDARLVEAVRRGQSQAFAQLVEAWFDRCWEVSWRILRDRDRAAEVTQDVMLTAWQKLDTLSSPGSFGGWVLRMSRNKSLDRLSHEQRMVPTDEEWMLEAPDVVLPLGDPEHEAQRREAHDLVWEAAAALGERDASILDLHLRHGLEAQELADELGIAPNAANQALHRMRVRLGTAIRARLLWRNGSPRCDELARVLASSRIDGFGPDLVRVIDRHAKSCDECARHQRQLTSPVSLFAAVPLVAVEPAMRAASAQVLAAHGVPVPATWSGGTAAASTADLSSADLSTADTVQSQAPASGAADGLAGSEHRVGDGERAAGTMSEAGADRSSPRRSFSRRAILLIVVAAVLVLAGALAAVSVGLSAGSPSPVPVTPTPSVPTPPSATLTPATTPRPTATPSATPPASVPTDPADEERPPVVPVPSIEARAGWVGVAGCPPETPFLYRIQWETTDADTVRLSGTWGSDEVALSGQAQRCGEMSAEFTITATGAGGEAMATVEAEATPAS